MADDYITTQPALVEGTLESATLRPKGEGTASREALHRPWTTACHHHVPTSPRAVGALLGLHSGHLGPMPWLQGQNAHKFFQGLSEDATSVTAGI